MGFWHKFKNNVSKLNSVQPSSYKTVHLAEMKGFLRVAQTKQFESDSVNSVNQAGTDHIRLPSKNYAQGTKVAYDYDLIEQLKFENRQLQMYFSTINLTLKRNELAEAAVRIEKFKSRLVAHFYKTTLKLYIYLQYSLKDQSESFSTLRDFRKKMTKTSTMILCNLDRYMHIDQKPELLDECLMKFAEIKKIIDQRISQEEKVIYPIYYLLKKNHAMPS